MEFNEDLHRTFQDDRLQKLRSKLIEVKRDTGASYEQLAYAIGVSFFTIMRWFNKGMKNPRPGSLRLLEQFLAKYDEAKTRGLGADFFKNLQGGQ